MRVHPEVGEALAARAPVVALESTIVAHGLPPLDEVLARHVRANPDAFLLPPPAR